MCSSDLGPIYLLVGLAEILTRNGFDVRQHALSLLSNGRFGWIQIANFLVSGALVIAGAIGTRFLLRGGRGGTWGPILLAGYGLGLIGAGLFLADPARGFPPGTPAGATQMSRHVLSSPNQARLAGRATAAGAAIIRFVRNCWLTARRLLTSQ